MNTSQDVNNNLNTKPVNGGDLVDNVTSGFNRLSTALSSLNKAALEAEKSEIERCIKTGKGAKERYLLSTLLRQAGEPVDQNATLEELRARFTKPLAEKMEIYYEADKGRWKTLNDQTPLSSDVAVQLSLPSIFMKGSLILQQGQKPISEQMITLSNFFDKVEANNKTSDQELAMQHSKDWYVNYKTLLSLNFFADRYWSDEEMKQEYTMAMSRYLKLGSYGKRGATADVYLDTMKLAFEREYDIANIE